MASRAREDTARLEARIAALEARVAEQGAAASQSINPPPGANLGIYLATEPAAPIGYGRAS